LPPNQAPPCLNRAPRCHVEPHGPGRQIEVLCCHVQPAGRRIKLHRNQVAASSRSRIELRQLPNRVPHYRVKAYRPLSRACWMSHRASPQPASHQAVLQGKSNQWQGNRAMTSGSLSFSARRGDAIAGRGSKRNYC
jgi:hypothetical protein